MTISSEARRGERWALLLTGGDGQRMRPLTRIIAGDERPKQFCRILGNRTLLEDTARRVALAVPARRTLLALTRAHERYYRDIAKGRPAHCLLVQPRTGARRRPFSTAP